MRPLAITLLAAALLAGAQTRDDADRMLKAAQNAELVDGNLNAAIKQYGAIVAKYARSDRGIAASALVRMADCYRKMGDAESRKIYEQVVRDYADQKDAVAMARARLGSGGSEARKTTALVWSGEGADSSLGAVSPDGRLISYTDWDTGDLALHEIATGQNRRITDTKQEKGNTQRVYAQGSAISRDGKQIAYGWNDEAIKRCELRLASLTGDPNPRRLYANPAVDWLDPTDWSPDGKWVAVKLDLKDGTGQLALVSVPDGGVRVLTTGKWGGDTRFSFSPDGKYLGYHRSQGEIWPETNLFVIGSDGTGETPVAPHRGRNRMMGWSPDGKRLLFASDRNGALSLWSVGFDGGKPQGEPELIKAALGEAWPIGMTRTGALYYAVGTGVPGSSVQVGSFDLATGKMVTAPRDVAEDYQESNAQPQWSPDGKYLAYVSRRGRAYNLHTLLVIRSAEALQVVRELQPKMSFYNLVGWAPDGSSLLAYARDQDGHRGAFRVDAQTGEASLLVADPPDQRLTVFEWLPDGKNLIYRKNVSGGKEMVFIQRDIASGAEKELIRRPSLGGLNPAGISRDHRFLFTASTDPSTNSRLMLLIPLDGGEPRVAMRIAADTRPEDLNDNTKGRTLNGVYWMPDGQSFLAATGVAGQKEREVWQIPIDGGAPRKLPWILDSTKFPWGSFRRDTQQLAFVVKDQGPGPTTEIWMLDHFLPTNK